MSLAITLFLAVWAIVATVKAWAYRFDAEHWEEMAKENQEYGEHQARKRLELLAQIQAMKPGSVDGGAV